jgi:PAS domain S-box-containing protein
VKRASKRRGRRAPATSREQRLERALRAAERRSLEQQQRADLLVRATQAGLLDWDSTTDRTTYSERLKEMLGYAPDTDTGSWPVFFELIHPEDCERVRTSFLSQLRDRSTPNSTRTSHDPQDYRVRRADGSWLWVHAEAISLTGTDGRTLRYICSFIDISERKQQEIELSDRIQFIRDLFDSVPIALALRDPAGRYLFVNRTWERYVGSQREEVVGARLHDQFTGGEADAMLEADRAALDRDPDAPVEPQDFAHRGRHYLQTRTVMNDAFGRPIGVLIASLDTTEQRAQEERLRDQMLLTRALIDENPNAMYLKDTQGRYVTVNDAWLEMVGVTREQAIGSNVLELFPEKESERYHAEDMRLIAQGDSSEMESLRTGPDGNPQWVIIRKAALRRADGTVIGLIGTNTDITALKRIELDLAERAKFVAELVDALPISVALRDPDGRYVLVNRTWEQYFGVKREDALGRRRRELPGWTGDPQRIADADEIERLDRETLARGPGYIAEPQETLRLGRHYLITRRALFDSLGKPIGVLSAGIDMTERREQDEQLRNQFKFINDLVESVPVSVAMRDTEGRYLLVNRTWEQYFGARREDVLGHTVRGRVPEPMASALLALDQKVLARGAGAMLREDDYEYRGRRYTQTRSVMADAQDKVLGVLIASLDTTTRYEMELALEHERERLQLLVRATKAGFMDWDARTDTAVYSERFKEMLGYPPDADTSAWPLLLDRMHPDDREPMRNAFRAMLHRVSSTGERLHGPLEYRLRKADGSYLWVRGEGIARIGEGGRTERFLTSYVDITHLRELNRALEESVRLREEVDRMSRHDLKTPLNAIIGISRLMQEEGRLSAEDAQLATRIEEAGFRLLGMINLSLDMFRMEQGTYPFSPKAVDLREVLDKVVRDLRSHAKAKRASVRIEGGAAHAWGEELLCYSMLANVTKNAIEASPTGGTVTVSIEPAEEGVSIRIHNAGAVPEAMRGRFFEKYSTAGKQGGLGLGTYSARLMARTQLGDIEMQTSETAGTTLAVRLSAAAAPQAERDSAERSAPPAPQLSSLAAGHSILVVDDDEFSRLVVQRLLPASSRVSVASNGSEALDAVLVDPPEAIVMDLDMPVMGGLEAAARIRASEKESGRKRCTMIAASSHDDETTRLRSLEAGFDAYLEKPVSADALRRLLADFFLAGEPVHVDPDLRDLLPGFLRSRRELAAELAQAVEAGAAETARALAHKLAGSFLPYGFHWAARQGKMIEQRARENALEGLVAEVRALREHLDTVEVRVTDGMAEVKR